MDQITRPAEAAVAYSTSGKEPDTMTVRSLSERRRFRPRPVGTAVSQHASQKAIAPRGSRVARLCTPGPCGPSRDRHRFTGWRPRRTRPKVAGMENRVREGCSMQQGRGSAVPPTERSYRDGGRRGRVGAAWAALALAFVFPFAARAQVSYDNMTTRTICARAIHV